MRQFFRGGRELPFEQSDKVTQLQSNKDLSSRPKEINKCILACVRFLRYGRNDGRKIGNIILRIFCVLFSWSLVSPAFGQEAKGLNQTVLRGVVSSIQDGNPIEGASVSVDKKHTRTDKQGRFTISVDKPTGVLLIKHIGYKEQRVAYENTSTTLNIALQTGEKQIEEVEVVSTGYQKIPKERATGSFEFIDSALFNRKVSTDFLSRLEDVVPGLSFDKSYAANRGNVLNMNVRGVSTLGSNLWPLVVIDGVPYENRMADYGLAAFNNINPNDVENITVLKDAAAASIWGAQSGNGVIVITTKRGKFNQKAQIAFNSNLTVVQKPDLHKYKVLPTADYIDIIRVFYDKGRYNSSLNQWNRNVDPLIWLLKNATDKKITEEELEAELDRLSQIDQRDDFMKYIYRPQIKQQHSLRLSQGSDKLNFSLGLGYDHNLGQLVTEDYQRINVKGAVQARPIKNLLLDISTTYTESKKKESWDYVHYNGLAKGVSNPPYMQLADANGNHLPVDISGLSPAYRDTVGGGRLQPYTYIPLDELFLTEQIQKTREVLLQLDASYKFDFGLVLSGLYAYQRNHNPISNWRSGQTFTIRDYANAFAQWDANKIVWNHPLGDNLVGLDWNHYAHQARFNLSFDRSFSDLHSVSLLGGVDVREVQKELKVHQYYGYDPNTGTFKQVEFGREIRRFNGKGGVSRIMDYNRMESLTNRFMAFYMNGSYTFKQRYIWSGSFRRDASNLFGVKANDRGQPFWSTGLAWVLSKEDFMTDSYFNYLKLRTTYGYNGNVNNSTSPLPIMTLESQQHYITGQPYGFINRPPNPNLRWERVANLNFGLDFGTRNGLFSGSIEYYHKRAKDLIAQAEVDPSVGFTHLTVNTADLLTKGWDISINAKPIGNKTWEWNSNLVFSNARTKVLKAYTANDMAMYNVSRASSVLMTPFEGRDLYSLLAFDWAGLDPVDGMPRAYLNGEITKDYNELLYGKTSSLKEFGTQKPRYFGSWRNSLRYKNIDLSWNISYQLGHKFIRETFRADFFYEQGVGHPDYALRWQQPGDEAWTDVPVFAYPIKATANQVYGSSSALIERGDQIKLRDIQASLVIPTLSRYGIKNLRVYAYVQNIGTLWQANKKGIDNEYGASIPDPLSTSLGINFNF
ncbi:TonB-linked outer membrane protein, SusC/RagA family [Sphingobacterium nematocida]|uniref:TonB-linked outer membrane protein, SusC/RagA family n=1 Tax=Sphingobacterium nematocida TaxID=1513896 RepID=A0A1T5GDN1_9SPHI|nr:SusC/RagA family TonB-linked outer membrane protein [Sphingobacterium nematocida]SKC06510.1 TonB-linked outer membrane protein, SusC/RagA family [Sphingobacterium nematocida]